MKKVILSTALFIIFLCVTEDPYFNTVDGNEGEISGISSDFKKLKKLVVDIDVSQEMSLGGVEVTNEINSFVTQDLLDQQMVVVTQL